MFKFRLQMLTQKTADTQPNSAEKKSRRWQIISPIALLIIGIIASLSTGALPIVANTVNAFTFNWAIAFQDQPGARGVGNGIASDAAGNVLTVGYFQDSVNLGGGADLTSRGQDDIFVSKLANDGSFIWSRAAGGTNQDEAKAVAVDSDGNVYSTGRFRLTADFNPGSGGELTSTGNDDIFIYKLNADGSFGWAHGLGGTNIDEGWGIATDSASNVYVSGFFSGTVDFDPTPIGTTELTSLDATNDIFTASFDSDGAFRWARHVSGPSQRERGDAITATDTGVYVTGYFDNAQTNFNPGSNAVAPYVNDRDVFIVKYGTAGAFQWVRSIGDSGSDAGNAIAADANGNIYVAGAFENTVNVEGTVLTGNADGMRDVFIASYTPGGNLRWATALTGPQRDEGMGIAVNADGTIHLTGFFGGPLVGGGKTITSAGDRDIFVATLDGTGAVLDLVGLGSTGEDQGQSIAVDGDGILSLTGTFANTVDFNPGNEATNLTSQGTQSIFVSNWTNEAGGGEPTPTPQPSATPAPGGDSNIYLPFTANDSSSTN